MDFPLLECNASVKNAMIPAAVFCISNRLRVFSPFCLISAESSIVK